MTAPLAAAIEAVTPHPVRAVRRAVMLQGWYDLTSIHWRYDPDVVQRVLPDGFRVDTFDGAAWVGVIPFRMERIRVPHLPPFGWLSSFPETNVRTYIVDPAGRRAVWFCSLDITRLVPALVARVTYRLPYCWAAMTVEADGDERTYTSRRRWPRGEASSRIRARIGEALEPDEASELDHFLSARWALGSTALGQLLWADVHHDVWPLHRAEVLEVDQTLTRAAGLPDPEGEPYGLWSPGVEVRIARPSRIRRPRPRGVSPHEADTWGQTPRVRRPQ